MSKTIATVLSLKDQFSSVIKNATSSTKDFQNQIKHTQNNLKEMKSAITGAFVSTAAKVGAVVLGASIVDFAKQSIMLASDLVEVKNVVDTTFGSSSKIIEAWSNTTMNSFGVTKLQAQKFTGVLGAMMKSSGVSGDGLIKMSEGLTGLAGDLGSFYNLDPADAFEKIKSAIAGQSKPMRELGIDMNVANLSAYALSLGIQKSWLHMNQAEQTTLRYNYLMKAAADAHGDFTKTSVTFANQLRIARSNIASMGAGIATDFLPRLANILLWFNEMSAKAPPVIEAIKAKIISLWKEFKVDSILNNLKTTAIGVFNGIALVINGIKKPFMDFVDSVVRLAKTIANDLFPAVDKVNKNVKPSIWVEVKDAISDVLKVATSTFNYINKNWKTIRPIVEDITLSIVAFKLALIATATWTTIVKAAVEGWEILGLIIGIIANATTAWGVATSILGIALDACGIGLVIVAVAALSLGIYELITHFKDICEWAGKAWDAISKVTGLDGGKKMVRVDTTNYNDNIDITKPVPKPKNPFNIPANASGTNNFRGGLTHINEKGGEIVNLPSGSQIIPHDVSMGMAKNKSGLNIQIIIQGNVIGNEEFANSMGEHISRKVLSALGNI